MLEKVSGASSPLGPGRTATCATVESDQYLSLLTPSDVRAAVHFECMRSLIHIRKRRTLAGKLLGIGKSMLRSSPPADAAGNGARDSVKWIQRAFAIIEPLEDAADAGDGQVRVSRPSYQSYPAQRSHAIINYSDRY